MGTWRLVKRTAAILVTICLTILNALSIFTSQTRVPPHISGIILTFIILFCIRGLRRNSPLGFVDALSLWIVFGAITVVPVLLILLPCMVFGGMWQATFIIAALDCLYTWLPTLGIVYLPGATVLVYLCWQRAETNSQKPVATLMCLLCGRLPFV